MWFVLIMLAGLLLRLIGLDQPLTTDEICSWAFARRMPFMAMWSAAQSDPTPPLYYALLHLVMRAAGDSPAVMRLPSVVFGALLLPVCYGIMRTGCFSRSASICGMLLVAASSMLVHYAQEIRAYSMLVFFGALSMWLLLRCLRNPSAPNRFCYIATAFICSYVHNYGLLLFAAQAIPLILYRRWSTLGGYALVVLLRTLLLILQVKQGDFYYTESLSRFANLGSLIALVNMLNVGTMELFLITGWQPGPFVSYPSQPFNLAISLAGAAVFMVIFLTGLAHYRHFNGAMRQFLWTLIICILVPAGTALFSGTDVWPQPQWSLRGLLYIWPLYYMVAAAACSRSRFRFFLIALVLLLNSLTLYRYYNTQRNAPVAAAFEQLNETADSTDLVIASPWYYYEVINYYYKGEGRTAAWDTAKGWVDSNRLRTSDKPFDSRTLASCAPPATRGGRVFFFSAFSAAAFLGIAADNEIYVYDPARRWKKYER